MMDPHARTLRDALDGDQEALAQLVRAYHDRVYRFGRRVCRDTFDAEDAVQEAYIKLARRPDVQRDGGVLSWLMSVVRNACIRMWRTLQRPAQLAVLPEEMSEDPERLLERWQLIHEVHRAIAALPDSQRQVLLLRDIEGLSGPEVARRLAISEATMKIRLHRARATMRQQLVREGYPSAVPQASPEASRQDASSEEQP